MRCIFWANRKAPKRNFNAETDYDAGQPTKQMRLQQEYLDQGKFPLCSLYAIATATSHAINAKYGMCMEPQRLADPMLDVGKPSKSAWPKELGDSLGIFNMKTHKRLIGMDVEFKRLVRDNETHQRMCGLQMHHHGRGAKAGLEFWIGN